MLRAVTHSSEVTDRCFSRTWGVLATCFGNLWKPRMCQIISSGPNRIKSSGQNVPVRNHLRTMLWRHMEEWRCRSTFLDLGTRWRWVVSFMPLLFYPLGRQLLVPIGLEAGWDPKSVWMLWRREKSYTTSNWNSAAQSITHHSTEWATPALLNEIKLNESTNWNWFPDKELWGLICCNLGMVLVCMLLVSVL
jgi:hypothetical protein